MSTITAPARAPRTTSDPSRPARLRPLPALLVAAGAALLLGGATSFAQTLLPGALAPLANSASGWTLLAVLVVAALRAGPALSAVLATESFLGLLLGYQLVSTWRGYPTSEVLFLIAGLVVGPFVGVATAWLRSGGARAALGCAALAGVALGEAAYGFLVVLATTGWVYWTLIALAGLGLLGVTAVRSLSAPGHRLLCVALTAAVATLFVVAYTSAGSIAL